jgi:predicted alpha/beta-fold hydrolase
MGTRCDAEYGVLVPYGTRLSNGVRNTQISDVKSNHPRKYRPAWFAPGPHARTLWARLFRRIDLPPVERLRWDTPDGDFVDVVRLPSAMDRPRVVLLHGLEGTSRSPYARGLLHEIARRGWGADLMLFRSCSGEINRARRFYHSGETGDLAFVVDRLLAEFPGVPLALAGVSLGGNVLLKYLGEQGDALDPRIVGAAAVSVPFDLGRGARWLGRGFGRVYEHYTPTSPTSRASRACARCSSSTSSSPARCTASRAPTTTTRAAARCTSSRASPARRCS